MGNENETVEERRARLLRELDAVDAECAALLVDPVMGKWTAYSTDRNFGTFSARPGEDELVEWARAARDRLAAAGVSGHVLIEWHTHGVDFPRSNITQRAAAQVARVDLARLLAAPVVSACEHCGGGDPRCAACAPKEIA